MKLHKDVAEAYDTTRSKHVSELREANAAALQKVKEPSSIRYGAWISFCLLVDIFVSPAVSALYAGVVTGIVAAIIVGILMAIFARIYLGKHAKRATEGRKELQDKVVQVQQDIEEARKEYAKFRKWAGLASKRYPQVAARVTSAGARLGRATKGIRPVGKLVTWIVKFFKNPVVKQGGEAVPVLNIIPFWTLGALAAYIAHRSEWKEAQRLLAAYDTVKWEVVGVTDDMYQTQLGVVEQEIVGKSVELNEAGTIATA